MRDPVTCSIAQKQLRPSFARLRGLTVGDNREHGHWVFETERLLQPGPVVDGDSNGLDIVAPTNQRPVGIAHTHPAGNPNPSRLDIGLYGNFQLDFGCIVTDRTACCDFLNLTDDERRELAAKVQSAPTYEEAMRTVDAYRASGKITRCCSPQ